MHISDPIDEIDFTKTALCALVNGEVIVVSAGSPSVLTASGTYILLKRAFMKYAY